MNERKAWAPVGCGLALWALWLLGSLGAVAPAVAQPAGAAVESPVEERVIELIDVRGLPLSDVLRLLSQQTGMNLASSMDAGAVVVNLQLRGVTATAAIDTLAKTHGLWYRRDAASGVIRLHTVREYQREIGSLADEKTEVFTLLYPNAVDVATAIRDLHGDRVQLSLGTDDGETTRELEERFDRFDLLDERSQGLGLFESGTGSSRTSASSRGGSGDDGRSSRGGALRRSDLSRDLRSQRAPQRAVEPQPLRGLTAEEIQALEGAAPGEGAAAAADLLRRRQATIYVTVIRRHNQIAVRTSDDRNMEQVRDLIRRLDVPTPLVLLEVKVLGIELGDGFRSAFDFQFVEGEAAGGFTTGDILPPAGASPSLLGSQLIPGALAFQYVGNQFRARMQLLENENRVTELATPLLLTANNEVSRLFVGEERPLNRSFSGSQTVVGDSTIVTPGSTTIEFRPVGTTLLITPNINADRTVSMRILQEISSISPNPATVLVPTSNGFAEQQVDVVQARSVSGTIVAKDGLAVAIGGLIEEQLTDSQQRVPILGNLPGVGFLFRKDTQSKTRRELVILVRPFVLYTPAESERISRDLLEELSLHPKAGDPRGHLGTHGPRDVVRSRTDPDRLRRYFRFHSLTPEERE